MQDARNLADKEKMSIYSSPMGRFGIKDAVDDQFDGLQFHSTQYTSCIDKVQW